MRLYNKEDKDGTGIEEVVTDVERESPSADRNSKKIHTGCLPIRIIFDTVQSVDVVTDHVPVVDKQVVIAVPAIAVFLTEACDHVAILPRFAPQRTVITAKVKTSGGELLALLQCLSEKRHNPTAAILLDGGKPDALAVDACTGRDAVLVKGFVQIRAGDFTKPIVCMRGKPGKSLVFENEFPIRIRFLFLGGIVYLLDTRPIGEDVPAFSFLWRNNANNIFTTVDKQASAFSVNPHIQRRGILFVAEIGFRRVNRNCFHFCRLLNFHSCFAKIYSGLRFRTSESCRLRPALRCGIIQFLRA